MEKLRLASPSLRHSSKTIDDELLAVWINLLEAAGKVLARSPALKRKSWTNPTGTGLEQ
jgi:hypothetical protein